MQVESSESSRFLTYVKPYIPESQIMRFLYLIDIKKELSLTLANHFMELALNNNLTGCYNAIMKKLGIAEEERFSVRRDAQQEATAKVVVDLRKNIVSLTNNV